MKKLFSLLMVLALCLPLCVVAEEAVAEEFELTGEWYSVMSTMMIKDTMPEAPESVDDLPEDYVSVYKLEGCSVVRVAEDVILCYALEDGAMVQEGLLHYSDASGCWNCLTAQPNEFLDHGIFRADEMEIIEDDDGISVMVWDMVQEFKSPITVLNENVFIYYTYTPGLNFMYVNIRKEWLDGLQYAE